MAGNVVFAIGSVSIVDEGTTRSGVVTIAGTSGVTFGGTSAGVEALLKSGATGTFEGCTFGAGTGATCGFSVLPELGQLGFWFALTVIHTVTVVVCVCGVTVTVTISVCARGVTVTVTVSGAEVIVTVCAGRVTVCGGSVTVCWAKH